MTIDEARKDLNGELKSIYDKTEAANITEIVMEHVTRWSRPQRIVNKDLPLTAIQKKTLTDFTRRLLTHEPIQYILNEAWFAGMLFYVDRNVLIPRPETEELVEWVVRDCQEAPGKAKRMIDIGTGSGCIAIALKSKLPGTEIWGCDISDEALIVARMNADALNATVDFVSVNFLDAEQRKQLPAVDNIVSNPPYVPQRDKIQMKKNVVDHEPTEALFVPDSDPLVFYAAIADFGKEKLNEDGRIYVETHEDLAAQVKTLFLSRGYQAVEIKKDLQGKERMVKAFAGAAERNT